MACMLCCGLSNLQECQDHADKASLLAMAIPICLAVAAAAYVARPPPQELKDSGQVFEDDTTGFLFEKSEGELEPERDKDVSVHPIALSWLQQMLDCVHGQLHCPPAQHLRIQVTWQQLLHEMSSACWVCHFSYCHQPCVTRHAGQHVRHGSPRTNPPPSGATIPCHTLPSCTPASCHHHLVT
jgi:hypothetical protein